MTPIPVSDVVVCGETGFVSSVRQRLAAHEGPEASLPYAFASKPLYGFAFEVPGGQGALRAFRRASASRYAVRPIGESRPTCSGAHSRPTSSRMWEWSLCGLNSRTEGSGRWAIGFFVACLTGDARHLSGPGSYCGESG